MDINDTNTKKPLMEHQLQNPHTFGWSMMDGILIMAQNLGGLIQIEDRSTIIFARIEIR